jgi:hypothetical protein
LDEVDAQRGYSGGPEGQRDLGSDLVIDRLELAEAGADLDDPEQMSLLQGAMDDPDGTAAQVRLPLTEDDDDDDTDAEGDERDGWLDDDEYDAVGDRRDLEIIDVDPGDLEELPDEGSGG